MSPPAGPLIRNGRVEADDWIAIEDDGALPTDAGARVIVSLDRWQREREDLLKGASPIGVRLPNTANVDELPADLLERPLLALEFPVFADGRAYSQAHVLAQRHRYAGELRAIGAAVVRDQVSFMARCGFTAFQLRADQDPQAALAALQDFPNVYQPAADVAISVLERRRTVTS